MILEDGNSKIFRVGQETRDPGRTDVRVQVQRLLAEFCLAEMRHVFCSIQVFN